MKNKQHTWGCPHHVSWDPTNPEGRNAYRRIASSTVEETIQRYWDTVEKLWIPEIYGLAGHVINSLWEKFKESEHYDSEIIKNLKSDGNTWKDFNLSCIKKLDGWREKVIIDSHKKWEDKDKQDWLNTAYPVYAGLEYDIKWIVTPSFIDYIIFFTAVSEVVEKLWEDTSEIMSHPMTKKIFTDFMQNNRDFFSIFLWQLEWFTGDDPLYGNINDEYRSFQKDFFEIHKDTSGKKYIRIKDWVVQNCRKSMQIALKQVNSETAEKLKNNVYTCPVLYTWLAIEIYDWLYAEMLKIKKDS